MSFVIKTYDMTEEEYARKKAELIARVEEAQRKQRERQQRKKARQFPANQLPAVAQQSVAVASSS